MIILEYSGQARRQEISEEAVALEVVRNLETTQPPGILKCNVLNLVTPYGRQPAARQKCGFSGPPRPTESEPHFNKLTKWFVCTFRLRKK